MTIKKLIEKYENHRAYYLSRKYNEAQLRIDFLDPFFELMGWDIKNIKGKSTHEREVLLEEPLKADTFSNTKNPDYTFRLFSGRKFFLEAKKPNVKINTDPESAKQLRRYGFTAKLKISVLSNFEYLAIYDCSQQVDTGDPVSKSRIKLYHYTEYAEAFEEIKGQLGYRAVYTGDFDKTWEHIEAKLKLFSVDSLFLNQINDWRLILGKEIFRHRPDLDVTALNDIVQSYINSIIFIRVCEDRSLEEYKTLLNFANIHGYQALINKFKEAAKKYNSGLFDHALMDSLTGDTGSAFWTIIKQLYYPESTYSFAVFASDILGNIYEIFLGQQLIIEDNVIFLVDKPDHLDRDIVTTPTPVIRDILRYTVTPFCAGKSGEEILNTSFIDISCGSGTFLLETYQLINDILVDYYLLNSRETLIQTAVNTYKLPYGIKRRIIENCIYGVDRDFNAVEACKFGLLLKLLEDENNATIPCPALPDLSGNIRYGNSLIGYDDKLANREEINPFDFGSKKFDVIVGNPPYMATEHMKRFTPLELPLYKRSYVTSYKQFDKYFLFIEKGLELLKDNGTLGYIVPGKFTKVGAGKKMRALLKNQRCVQYIISFGANQIFQDKTTYTCILVLQKKRREVFNYIEVRDLSGWQLREPCVQQYDTMDFDELGDEEWVLVSKDLKPVYTRINAKSKPLEEVVGSDNIFNGIQTSANNIYIHTAIRQIDNFIYFKKDGREWKIEKELTRPYYKTVSGGDNLNTYRPFIPNAFVIYPYLKKGDRIEFVEIRQLMEEYPCAYEYLTAYKEKLNSRNRDIKPVPETNDEWYRYGRHQSLEKCDVSAKIVVGVLSQGNKYAIDYHRTLISSGGTAGYCMITLPENFEYSIYYIQALLNSRYLEWHSALMGEVFRGGYIARGTKVLKRLPVRIVDFNDEADKILHDKIAVNQKELIRLRGEIDAAAGNKRKKILLERDFVAIKDGVDESLKKLFDLGDSDNLVPLVTEKYAIN